MSRNELLKVRESLSLRLIDIDAKIKRLCDRQRVLEAEVALIDDELNTIADQEEVIWSRMNNVIPV